MTAPTPSPARYVSPRLLVKTWLKDVLGYPNVSYRVPTNLTYVMPTVVVNRFGGSDATLSLDTANMDIDVYAADEDAAEAQAEHIRRELRLHLTGYRFGRSHVNKVETISAPQERPYDSRATAWRYGGTYRLYLHQHTGL